MMADRPILFSAPMVRALIEGRKTQTRRVLKPQPYPLEGRPGFWNASGQVGGRICISDRHLLDLHRKANIGDRLWVRETWSGEHEFRDVAPAKRESFVAGEGEAHFRENVWFWADGNPDFGYWERPRPSIHMPRWASRITLTVTDVRIERLNDIGEEDAIAEGVVDMGRRDGAPYSHCIMPGVPSIRMEHDAVPVYAGLWEHIHGEGSWRANPWIVAYTFSVALDNIDQIGGDA